MTDVAAYSVQLVPKNNGAILAIELSDSVPYVVSALRQPDRLVIDLPKVAFVNTGNKAGAIKAGPVNAYRYGLFFADRSRVVMDLAEPALIDRVETTAEPGRKRLIFHISKTDRTKFLTATTRNAIAEKAVTATGGVPSSLDEASKLPLVVLDPGHGGIDPGAGIAGGGTEKVIVYALAEVLKERLEKNGKVRVAMTRTGDVFISLSDRVKFARQNKAALMVSLHADTLSGEAGVRGATIYTLSNRASDVVAAKLADSENKADLLAGIEVREETTGISDILLDLALRETRHLSHNFARGLAEEMQPASLLHKNPLKSAGFRVLTAPDVPSVLIELGYLSSVEDAKLMQSLPWRNKMAELIAVTIEKRFGENATRGSNSTSRP